ncbi:hypothetical protein AQS8620_01807 [Aquimixticola soesokkakensis]|uniref:DUF924 domain-containing protein n=1 Tax=Aquimixticola soesokkakensis TaxID=1519096 RepID=A0A1Y5STD3_9RHOB|nr:DUF924 family protein [Aquimixticola soesokkakensis]SLN44679.1 hypothetical protein AQS8620_01807 [Aquimixticola soesokkakensis]
MKTAEKILAFWLDEIAPESWYKGTPELDAEIRARFMDDYARTVEGANSLLLTYASGALAYIILLDQFPRNMFRGEAGSFRTDRIALTAAKAAIEKGWDMKIDAPARQFFYLPLMHSENLTDQDRCVRLIASRMPAEKDGANLRHAQAHREIIRRFGRFPHRNAALGRDSTPAEVAFLAQGGYGSVLTALAA